jgi:excisionase family DNA binding protein
MRTPSTAEHVDGPDDILTAVEAARLLRISRAQVYTLTAAGQLPHVRVSPRCVRYRRGALLAWFEAREKGRNGGAGQCL